MTQSKHTSGPWKVKRNGKAGKTFFIWRNDDHKMFSPDYDGKNENYECVAQNVSNEANARLIAAAPELLEALEQIIQPTMINGDKQIKVDWQQLAPGEKIIRWESAKKTIAKARGK